MYQELDKASREEIENSGEIFITIKPGWEQAGGWSDTPYLIKFAIATERFEVFRCYVQMYSETMAFTDIHIGKDLEDAEPGRIEVYARLALEAIIEHADLAGKLHLMVDTTVPQFLEWFIDHKFNIKVTDNLICRAPRYQAYGEVNELSKLR